MPRRCRSFIFLLLLTSSFLLTPCLSASYYISTSGSSTASGTIDDPWDMASGLNNHPKIEPGDTIWIRGGVYEGRFVGKLYCNATHNCIVRNFEDEHVRIDGANGEDDRYPLYALGSYTWYWGLELMISRGPNFNRDGDSTRKTSGVLDECTGCKFINLVIHDSSSCGIMSSYHAVGTEIVGNLIYYNGWDEGNRGHGHGLYLKNLDTSPVKLIRDNIVFRQFCSGFHPYSENAFADLDGLVAEGNIVFNNGDPSQHGWQYSMIWGSTNAVSKNCRIEDNYCYRPGSGDAIDGLVNFGYSTGTENYIVRNNVFVGTPSDYAFRLAGSTTGMAITGNVVIGDTSGFESTAYPDNQWYADSERADATELDELVVVRPNPYEAGRAHIVVYNWANALTVNVDVSSVSGLAVGDCYELRDAENFFGPPVMYGHLPDSRVLVIQMGEELEVAPIEGLAAPISHTSSEFGAYVLVPHCYVAPPSPALVTGIVLGVIGGAGGILLVIAIVIIVIFTVCLRSRKKGNVEN